MIEVIATCEQWQKIVDGLREDDPIVNLETMQALEQAIFGGAPTATMVIELEFDALASCEIVADNLEIYLEYLEPL